MTARRFTGVKRTTRDSGYFSPPDRLRADRESRDIIPEALGECGACLKSLVLIHRQSRGLPSIISWANLTPWLSAASSVGFVVLSQNGCAVTVPSRSQAITIS